MRGEGWSNLEQTDRRFLTDLYSVNTAPDKFKHSSLHSGGMQLEMRMYGHVVGMDKY